MSNHRTIRLGISTCPNDTFAFHALLNRLVDWRGLDFQVQLLDIEDLNKGLFGGQFDVAKCSFHAALHLADAIWVLPSGSALGFGVGPLLLSARPDELPSGPDQLTLCPGKHTTATLLFRLFHPDTTTVQQVVFSDIMPRLRDQTADFGVCIHEGRFTWQSQGLALVEDLGTRWEQETGCPLPLGGLVGSRSLPSSILWTVQSVIADSLRFARANPDAALPTMRHYAQEFDDEVLMDHVRLYVNDWTTDLGPEGARSLQRLSEKAQKVGLLPVDSPGVQVLPPHPAPDAV
ncbi:1,4-dihydroxy-6-naphthoate synthase [Roseiconus nitratireducens]|uniref:1,4-dihydroxy-6-naphtoate synthase n=1 Tax=Roseiconus nitratireducens TaxID=2605748 RepID=A0A5M6DFX5_9BACT|nr:1,4-dihydroxy-6-naphthoate synthase [Roseiconus nitratireducens]KAA5545182.1 1,4-dihydroxy-6-naphthoate synthase [Roseiconus nitratireducens]